MGAQESLYLTVPEMLLKIRSETRQDSSLELNMPSVNLFIYDFLFTLYNYYY